MSMMTLLTKFEAYLLTEKCVARHTFFAYKRDILQCTQLLSLTSDAAILAVDKQQIRTYLGMLKDMNISARSAARKLSSLKLFFTYVGQLHPMEHPIQDIQLPKIEHKLPHVVVESEMAQLLQVADTQTSAVGIRNKVMLYLMYVTGMRVSELVKLHIDDLLFESGFVLVRGKGGKQRHIPLPEPMIHMLKTYLETAHPNRTCLHKHQQASPYLFSITYGGTFKPLTRQAFWMILKDLWAKTGIERPLSPHIVRHSLATHLLKNGADLRSLQLILGHENLSTVQMYTHVETSHLREVYNKKHPRSE